jgi:transposase
MYALLYMVSLSAVRCNLVLKAFANRLKQAGKPPKVILMTYMRKFLTIMNTMLKHNTPWQAQSA